MSYKSANEQSFGCDKECHVLEHKKGLIGLESSQSDDFKSFTDITTLNDCPKEHLCGYKSTNSEKLMGHGTFFLKKIST